MEDIERMRERKRMFISGELLAVLKLCECGIVDAEYEYREGKEYCVLSFESGYRLPINITIDSNCAIVRDVFLRI